MRWVWMLCAAAALALAAAGCTAESDLEGRGGPAVDEVRSGGGTEVSVSMTPDEAEQIATQQVQGRVMDTELVREGSGAMYYAVTVKNDEEPDVLQHTVYVDPSARRVARVEDRSMLQAAAAAIPQEQARDVVVARLQGRITDADLMNLDGRAVYVFRVSGQNDVERLAYVDANTGEFVKSTDLLSADNAGGSGNGQR